MPDSKRIIFEAQLDTSSFGPAIDQLKRKLDQVTQSQSQTASRLNQQGTGILGGSIPKAEEIYKTIRALETLQNLKKNSMRDAERELAIEKEKLSVQKEMLRFRTATGGGGTGGGAGGGGNNNLRGADWSGVNPPAPGIMVGKVVDRIGSAAAVLGAASIAIERIAGYPMRLEQAKGSAVQSFVGRDIQAAQSGQAKWDMPWMGERARASEMAESKRNWSQIADIGLGLTGVAGIIGGLTAMGGAVLGAPLSGGLSLTALAPGATMLAAGSAALYNDRARSSVFDPAGHNRLLEAQQGQDLMSTWKALQEQDPRKGAAIGRLRGRYSGDLQTQRMLGLNDQELMGFQTEANVGGFNEDLRAAMATQIQGAGGSTAGARGLPSMLALQAQRGLNMTNAGGVFGRLTGAMGGEAGAAQSEQVFRRLMEESITIGLNKSDMVEEQRRFTDVTSEIIGRTGATTAGGAGRIAEDFSKYFGGNPSIRGMEGAKGAYEQIQSATSQTGGRGGALQFASMMQNPTLKSLGPVAMANLMEMPYEDMNASNPYVQLQARVAGQKPEELANQLRSAKMKTVYATIGLNQNRMEDLQKYVQGNMGGKDLGAPGALEGMDTKRFQEYTELSNQVGLYFSNKNPFERQSIVNRLAKGEGIGGPAAGAGAEYNRGMTGGPTRSADEVIAASGVEAQKLLDVFARYKDVITPATAALSQFLDVVFSARTAAAVNQAGAMDRYTSHVPVPLRGQVQGGKPAPGIFGALGR